MAPLHPVNDEKTKIFNTFFAGVFTADNGTDPRFPARVATHVRAV